MLVTCSARSKCETAEEEEDVCEEEYKLKETDEEEEDVCDGANCQVGVASRCRFLELPSPTLKLQKDLNLFSQLDW